MTWVQSWICLTSVVNVTQVSLNTVTITDPLFTLDYQNTDKYLHTHSPVQLKNCSKDFNPIHSNDHSSTHIYIYIYYFVWFPRIHVIYEVVCNALILTHYLSICLCLQQQWNVSSSVINFVCSMLILQFINVCEQYVYLTI